MKRLLIFVLVLLMIPTVLAGAESVRVVDDSGLIPEQQVQFLEDAFAEIERTQGFTPVVVTIDSFGGLSAEEYAGNFYDAYGYGYNGMLYLVSLDQGQWYILTNGRCADLIADWEVKALGEELAGLLRQERYYDAFMAFGERSAALMHEKQEMATVEDIQPQPEARKPFGKTAVICMAVGLGIGLVTVLVMASQMKTVRVQHTAGDYVRPGSTQLTHSRDIFLYSHVHRTPKPKSNSSGGSHGGSRGGAGGRI